jgi:hypothetical protein
MKHRTTGWLAWGALAVMIGVPSIDVMTSKSKNTDSKVDSAALEEKKGHSPELVLVTKQPLTNDSLQEEIKESGSLIIDDKRSIIVSSIDPQVVENQEIIVSDMKYSNEFIIRVVGDEGMTIGSNITKIDDEAFNKTSPNRKLVSENQTEIIIHTPEQAQEQELPAELVIETVKAKPAVIEYASVDTEHVRVDIAQNEIVSIMPPKSNVIQVIEQPKLHQVSFQELVNSRQSGSAKVISIAPSRNVGNTQFHEVWKAGQKTNAFVRQGSFESQLPARRGSAIRLDLVN